MGYSLVVLYNTLCDHYCTGSTATCKRPIDIQNGNIFVTPGGGSKKGTNEQQQAVYQCDDGYTLIGNSTRDCNDGRWEGLAPQCIRNGMMTAHRYIYKFFSCGLLAILYCNKQ